MDSMRNMLKLIKQSERLLMRFNMHFYDAVCADPSKALAYAKQVKALAQKALDEASDVLEDTTTSVS